MFPSKSDPVLSADSMVSSGARNGVKISPIGFRSTLLLTSTLVNTPPSVTSFRSVKVKILRFLDPDIK
jgi:hypothetical protein